VGDLDPRVCFSGNRCGIAVVRRCYGKRDTTFSADRASSSHHSHDDNIFRIPEDEEVCMHTISLASRTEDVVYKDQVGRRTPYIST